MESLLPGLMFLWGMSTAVFIRWLVSLMRLSDYPDNGVQRRITGVSVDFMIVATLVGAKVEAIWGNIIPIALVSLLVSLFTIGLMPLRIVDPDFNFPATAELGLYNLFALVLLPLSMVTYPLPSMNVMTLIILLAGYTCAALAALKLFGFWKKKT